MGSGSNEGTAARTRPLSVEQILLRRKRKSHAAETKTKAEAGDPREQLREKNSAWNGSRYPVSDSNYNHHYKSKSDVKDRLERTSRNKETSLSAKEDDNLKHKSTRKYNAEASTKEKWSLSKSSSEKHGRNDTREHHRSKTDHKKSADLEIKTERKRANETTMKDKDTHIDKRPQREHKRPDYSENKPKIRSEISKCSLKRHDSHKVQESDYSENDERQRDIKYKRRRSRSRENDFGLPPMTQKRSHHGRYDKDHSEFPLKEKSVRSHSEHANYKTSQTGGHESGHYRHHGSGLGGYSPRKRRSEASAKEQSPTICSPDKKATTWDLPPVDSHSASSQPAAAITQSEPSSISIASTTVKSQPAPLPSTVASLPTTLLDSVELTQATRPMRRLYIENLSTLASDKTIIEWLNESLLSSDGSHIQGISPCISCIINKEKCQAVVEFLTPEDATAALSFNGRSFFGSVLKIRRPKDFVIATVATTAGALNKSEPLVKADHTISDVVKDSSHKIFIGGISMRLSSGMLMDIVSAFGALKGYRFELNMELNEQCAFLEYVDQSITLKACAGLNGMKLGGQVLTVVRAHPSYCNNEADTEDITSYGIPEQARPLLQNPTQVVKLKNMFNPEEFLLLPESQLEETLEDIRLECTRFGNVKCIDIVRKGENHKATTATCERNPDLEAQASSGLEDLRASITDLEPSEDTAAMSNDPFDAAEFNEFSDANKSDSINYLNGKQSTSTQVAHDLTQEETFENHVVEELHKAVDDEIKMHDDSASEKSSALEELSPDEVHHDEENHGESNAAKVGEPDTSQNYNDLRTSDMNVFEPGAVFVEFMRIETACTAAHCLNGRLYGDRVVTASYVAHDAYLDRFSRP